MLIKSTRFGDLDIDEKDIIVFSNGLPGFSEERGFVLLPFRENSPFSFLQSVSEANLAFLTVDPFAMFKDYEFKLDDILAEKLSLSEKNPPQILSIVTVPENAEKMTANLLAPIVINVKNKQAVQIVLEKSLYTTRHLLFPQGFSNKTGKEGK